MEQDPQWQQQAWQQSQQASPYSCPPQQPAPQKKSYGWVVAVVSIIAVFLLLALSMVSCTQFMSSAMSSAIRADVSSGIYDDSIAVIDIDGTIAYDGSACSPEGLKILLDEAEEDPFIKGVVLRVDSGGGTATAGEEMSGYVRDFSKPIVVSSASMNASAAYEISSQADYIYTAKTTALGAIGTAMELTDISGLLEKLGINIDTITSSESKDSSYGFRALSEEEQQYYQDMVNAINETFIETVAEGRGMTVEEVRELATGLTFTGMEAVENGLADEIGTREDAIAKAAELAGIEYYDVVDLDSSSYDISGLLDLLSMKTNVNINLTQRDEWESYESRIL